MARKFVVPKRIGTCADKLYTLKKERIAAQKLVDAMKVNEQLLTAHIIDTLPKSNTTGVAGKLARVSVVTKAKASVKDWDAFYAYIHRHKRYELLNRAVSQGAVKEIWENGKEVPGVESFNAVSVSIGKV